MPRRMMVFDRRHCRWRPWHGTRAAWLKLPHAAATGVCLLGTAMLQTATPLPAVPAHPAAAHTAAAPAPAPLIILATAVVPSGPELTEALPAESADGGALPEFQPTVWPVENGYGAAIPSLQMIALPAARGIEYGREIGIFDSTGRDRPPVVPTAGGSPKSPRPVPEPASATLLLAALGLLIALRGRSRHAAAPVLSQWGRR